MRILLLIFVLFVFAIPALAQYPEFDVVRYGAKCDDSTDNSTAMTAAVNAAIARGGGVITFPGGAVCRGTITILQGKNLVFRGKGRGITASVIKGIGGNPAVQANGLWYSKFENLLFTVAASRSGAVFELDGNYDGSHTQGVQGNTFQDCYFEASLASYALAIVRQGGGGGQGSENLFINCHFQSPVLDGVYIGGANALQNTFIGGNFQAYLRYGINCAAGSFNVYSVGFQYAAATVGVQIEREGWDIYMANSTDDQVTIQDCRTESPKFLFAANRASMNIVNNTIVPPVAEWTQATVYAQGAVVKGKTAGNGDGKFYIAIVGGTSAASEPTWPASNVVYDSTGGTITASSTTPTLADSGGAAVGQGIIINGAGTAGAALYSTITATGPVTINNAAVTSVTNQPYRFGAVVVDGTVTWMQYDYYAVNLSGALANMVRNNFPYGRTLLGQGIYSNNIFSRADWIGQGGSGNFAGNTAGANMTLQGNRVYRNGGPNTGSGSLDYAVGVRNGGPVPVTFALPYSIGQQTLIWSGGTGGTNSAEIYLAPDLPNNRVTFQGGKLRIGASGADISTILTGTDSLDYAQASANTCETKTLTVTSAADGNTVHVGIPHALQNHNSTATFNYWVSASDTVAVRRCVISADGSDPAAATVRATVFQY